MEQTQEEKIWTHEELEKVRSEAHAECYKKWGSSCELGEVEMYDHDGGEKIKDISKKQWVYFTCKVCNYQWALHKLLRRLEEGDRI